MRKPERVPPDWKKRVAEELRCYSPSIREQMLRLLRSTMVQEAVDNLWDAARKCPGVREEFHVLVGEALYELALAKRHRAWRSRTAAGWRKIAEALEAILDDNLCFRDNGPTRVVIDGVVCEIRADQASWARKELTHAAIKYQQMSTLASRTKPPDIEKREVLLTLRLLFRTDLDSPCDDAVAYLMEAAFDEVWTAEIVRSKASEWKG